MLPQFNSGSLKSCHPVPKYVVKEEFVIKLEMIEEPVTDVEDRIPEQVSMTRFNFD